MSGQLAFRLPGDVRVRARNAGRIALRVGNYALRFTALGLGILVGGMVGAIGLMLGAQPDERLGRAADWIAPALAANGISPALPLGIVTTRMICEGISVAGYLLFLLCIGPLFTLLHRTTDKALDAMFPAKAG